MKPIPHTPEAGVALMATAMFIAPLMDLFAKLLTETLSPGMIGIGRFGAQSLVLLPLLFFARQWGRPTGMHLLAGLFLAAALIAFNSALKHMPIANAISIFFVEPLILTLLSAYLLGEGLGWRRLSAVFIGLVGAMVVIRPNWAAFGPAALYPLGAACGFAGYMLIVRVMTQKGGRLALQFWIGMAALGAMIPATLIGDRLGVPVLALGMPQGVQWAYLAAMGLVAAISHQMISNAFARAEAGALAPLQYLEIIAAVLIGWFVFHDFPDPLTWLGTAIIIGSGIYVFHRERQLARHPRPA
jgi:drug/metabolite transporter (DMT)-like permease